MAGDEVSVSIVPGQTFMDPLEVITGIVGAADELTVTGADVALQLPLPAVTENVPELDTVIDCVVAPFDHR